MVWILTNVRNEEKAPKQSDTVNRDDPAKQETEKGQKEEREEIRHKWTRCR